MIVTIQLPGSLAQGDLISRLGDVATINAGGLILTGPVVRRRGAWLDGESSGHTDTPEGQDGPSAAKNRGVQE